MKKRKPVKANQYTDNKGYSVVNTIFMAFFVVMCIVGLIVGLAG